MSTYRTYWDEAVETMPLDKLRQLENNKLREQLSYVHRTSPFYRKKFDDAGVDFGRLVSVADLPMLPFTTKDDLRQTQTEVGSLGGHQCAPMSEVVRIQGCILVTISIINHRARQFQRLSWLAVEEVSPFCYNKLSLVSHYTFLGNSARDY